MVVGDTTRLVPGAAPRAESPSPTPAAPRVRRLTVPSPTKTP